MKKVLLILLALSLCALDSAFAQSRKITGTVTSSDDGQPLPGVSVKVTGTNIGTQSNAQGDYSINIPAGTNATSLTFNYIGYTNVVASIGVGNTISVKMISDSKSLNEVIVTGYGTQRKRETTGAISSISGSKIEDLPQQTLDRAIQGRLAGVQVTSNGGQPGGGLTVQIRGVKTINGSTQPLYVIDGVQVSGGTLSGQASLNVLSSINPDDIESIEVLKDAATASIYGSLAANGVVLVTTKRGKAGKTQVNVSGQYGTTKAYNPYEVLNATEWYSLRRESLGNRNQRQGLGFASGAAEAASTYLNGQDPNNLTSYNWVDAIFKSGKVQQYDISARGGDDKTKFFVSASYNGTEGTTINSVFRRGTVRANLDHKISSKLSLEATMTLAGSEAKGPSTNAGFFTNGAFTGALFTAPINPIFNSDGTFNTTLRGSNSQNIVQNATLEKRVAGTFQTVSNMAVNYSILPSLRLRVFGGLDFSDIKDQNYRPSTLSAVAPTGSAAESFRRNINWNTSGTLNYDKKFGTDHSFSALAGYEFRSVTATVLGASSSGFASPLLTLLSNGSTPNTATSTFTQYRISSFFGNVKYAYKDKYLFNGTIRNDGSSRFGADQRFGLFYGGSGAWRITGEEFAKNVSWLNDLKLRVSYGVVGQQPTNDFGALSLYGAGGQYGAPTPILPGLRPTQLANPNLTWEESKQTNLGLDFSLFNNRLSGSIDAYTGRTTQLLLNRTLATDTGFGSILENGGKLSSKGLEFALNSTNVSSKSFTWTTAFNISFQKNKLLELTNGATRIGNTYIIGEPLNLLYTYRWAGVNPADGRPMYYKANGDLTYSPLTADQAIIGDSNPEYYGGLTNTFTYKGVTLDFLIQYQHGNESYLQAAQVLEWAGSGEDNQVRSQLNRWTTPGQITSVPRPYEGGTEPGGYDNTNLSSRFVETASYARLKQVSLSYGLPERFTKKIGVQKISVFVTGINLYTYTHYRGDDPENTGNNLNAYPNPRTITGGIKLNL